MDRPFQERIDEDDETTSLLPRHSHDPSHRKSIQEAKSLEKDSLKTRWTPVRKEFVLLLKSSVPVILAYTLQNSLQTISVLVVGRLSPEALATAAFSYMFAMATGWLIALGGTTAIDTLASAAFSGGHNPYELGIILQRAFVVLAAFYVPVVVLWFASEPLLLALGQEAYLARDASRFLMVLSPGGLGYIYFEAMKKYLQAQGILPKLDEKGLAPNSNMNTDQVSQKSCGLGPTFCSSLHH